MVRLEFFIGVSGNDVGIDGGRADGYSTIVQGSLRIGCESNEFSVYIGVWLSGDCDDVSCSNCGFNFLGLVYMGGCARVFMEYS